MAIDRNIISWDLVFSSKSYSEILNMLITNYRAIYGSDIDLFVNTADGENIRMLAQFLFQFSQLANDVYNSLDYNNARGSLLDNIMFLSGNLIRRTAAKTRINGLLSWDASQGEDFAFDPTQDIFILQDNLNRMWRIMPRYELADLDDDGILIVEEVNDRISLLVDLENLMTGDYLLENPILQLTLNGSFVTGSNITLGSMIIEQRGSDNETDLQLRSRKKETLAYNSTSLVDSIRDVVLNNIYSIQDIKIYNSNINMNVDVNGDPIPGTTPGINVPLWNGTTLTQITVPLHDVFVLIKPQEGVTVPQGGNVSLALVDVIKRKITLGISTWQTNDLGANYQQEIIKVNPQFPGYEETIKYYIAQPYKPVIKIKVVPTGSAFNLGDTITRVREAMYYLARDYAINKDINIAEIMNEANNKGNIDVNNPTFRIETVTITNGSGSLVNNGYWYVDGIDDPNIVVEV